MTNKHCLVYETLGKVSNLQVCESAPKDMMRLTGVFGVCGIKNQNNRIYDRENYRQMVESLQQVIKESGCPGELEHPNSMNINLENVSHKIEDIQMNEDGTVTGTILLLNTPKGQIAQAIVEGGLPLYISSRGAGTITNEGRVTLSTIKTYDLVGTPGFSQAKLTLKENQTLECLNESLDDGNVMYAIVEGDDLLGDDDSDKKDNKKSEGDDLLGSDDSSDEKDKKDDKKSDEDDKEEGEKEEKKKKKKEEEDSSDKNEDKDNKNNKETVKMNDLKNAIDKLTDKVTSLEAELHIAKESFENVEPESVNYAAVEKWITEEAMPKFKESLMDELNMEIAIRTDESVDTIAKAVQNWVVEEFAPEVQNWVVEEFAPEVQNWITEEYSPEIQGWITEEFAPEVQNWITEEFAPEVQNWITEEFAPVIDGWITEEFAPAHTEEITEKVNENVSAYLAENKAGRLEEIDSLLETLSDNSNKELKTIVEEHNNATKFSGVYVVENMPAEYRPSWELLNEAQQNDIVRRSKMYDFTKEGVLESFWANVDFNAKKEDTQPVNESINNFHNNIARQMQYLRLHKG